MNTPVIRIHVGAHKTATTYIQDTLALNRIASAAAGTAYWPREQFRKALAKGLDTEKIRRKTRVPALSRALTQSRKDAVAGLSQFFATDYNVTISEENLLGEADNARSGKPYPFARDYLGLLKDALPDRPIEIYLAVRAYPDFISSLFGEALKHGHYLWPAHFRSIYSSAQGVWPEVIASIQDVFPQARLTVWRYEDFGRLEDELLSRLSGIAPDALIKPAQTDILPSASAGAILEHLEQAQDMNYTDRQMLMLALQHKHPRSGPDSKFSLWPGDEATKLLEEYKADLEQIKCSGDLEFLK